MIIKVDDIEGIPIHQEMSVVINYETKVFTALAVASALKFIKKPVLIIDCHSKDGSLELIKNLFSDSGVSIYLFEKNLDIHGLTLDFIFRKIRSERVWLIDSDLEILQPEIIDQMRAGLQQSPENYGAGLLQESCWLGEPYHNYPERTYFYYERPFIPLTLLKTEKIRELLNAGASFAAKRVFNEFHNNAVAKMLSHRFKLPVLKNIRSPGRGGDDPPLIEEFDTGSWLHREARAANLCFYKLQDEYWRDIFHFEGVTRSKNSSLVYRAFCALNLISSNHYTEFETNLEKAKERLKRYFPDFSG